MGKNTKRINNAPRMVSLFSGCGGLDLGFKKAGFDLIWANDFDADAQAVYSLPANKLGEIDGRDIMIVDENEIPDCDILTAGFPCQPFSNAGNRKGIHDSRGMLYKECLRIIKSKKPKVIVFENVKGLLSTKYIDGRNLVDVIREDLSAIVELGYDVTYQLLNASDYGVPQNRQRVFFIGVRKDLNVNYIFPDKQSKENLTLRNILDVPEDVSNQVDWVLSPQALDMIEHIPEGGSWKNVPSEHLAPRFLKIRNNMKKYHSPNFYRRFSRDEINGTITAAAQPENCGIIHPTENRRYTIREIARIQSFPDDFLFIDKTPRDITAMYKVIGNAVPVELARNIAVSIMEQVFMRKEQSELQANTDKSYLDTDKAYLLGLIIGGGIFGNAEEVFRIKLPYKQWGSYEQNPKRAGQIARDIMTVVSPMFKSVYGLNISYDTDVSGAWNILCEGDLSELKTDLTAYGIKPEGELCKNVSIKNIVSDLVDDTMKRRFIAGLADTIGSTNMNHRRFTNEIQILSFELKGYNFSFVCELCRLLYSVNCFPDQILWNHPNFHCPSNPYYKQWNKGFKLRIQLDQYADFGAFAFRTKAESSLENRKLQQTKHSATPCPEREIHAKISCVHPAENSKELPSCIRGGHYIHNRHVCAVLGCEHAPYEKIKDLFNNAGELISPFPVLCKDSVERIASIVDSDPLLKNREYSVFRIGVSALFKQYEKNNNALLYGDKEKESGYPLSEIMQGIAYIIADNNELNGKRPKGNFTELIKRHIDRNPDLSVEFQKPDLLTPLIITDNNRSALIGACNPYVYKMLITVENEYKLCCRPITEEDMKNA